MLRNYKDGIATIYCIECKRDFQAEVPDDAGDKFLEEFGQYANPTFLCTNCGKVRVAVNMNLPEGEFDEEDLEYEMPYEEINARKVTRDLMWAHRKDLRGKDRAAFNKDRRIVPRGTVERARQLSERGKRKGQSK